MAQRNEHNKIIQIFEKKNREYHVEFEKALEKLREAHKKIKI